MHFRVQETEAQSSSPIVSGFSLSSPIENLSMFLSSFPYLSSLPFYCYTFKYSAPNYHFFWFSKQLLLRFTFLFIFIIMTPLCQVSTKISADSESSKLYSTLSSTWMIPTWHVLFIYLKKKNCLAWAGCCFRS